MRVLSVVGNRPQFIKSAPLSLALRAAGIDEAVLHTGQHWDAALSGIFFDELGLDEPRYRLDLHTADAAAMEPGIRAAVETERPDWVLVYGDTNSTLAGAEAAGDTPRGPRRGGVAQLRPDDARRAEPDRRRPALGACCSARTSARSEQLAERRGVRGGGWWSAT